MALAIEPTREIKGVDLLTALAMFGNSSNHPYMLMRNMDYELALISYRELFGKMPTSVQDLMVPEVEAAVNDVLSKLRAYYQSMVDSLVHQEQREKDISEGARRVRERREEELRLQKAGKDFIKNNIVDYGGKTVAQLSAELGISKGEVRRRKAAGEL